MPHHHAHLNQTHPTEGIVIHKASLYNTVIGPILRSSEKPIIELARIKKGDKVLDLGCGPGELSLAVKAKVGPTGEVYGLDAGSEMIAVAQRKAARQGLDVHFQVGLIEALPFPDATFDVVVSRLVIHHLPGDLKQRGFAEMYRVLKPGGYCLAVDFEPPTNHLLKAFLSLILGKGMLQHTMVPHYPPFLVQAGFKAVEIGKTGHQLLSYVRGQVEASAL